MLRRTILLITLSLTLITGAFAAPKSATHKLAAVSAAPAFFLHDGDRVVFYGDSITEQRMYGEDIETYVLTRFPHMHVSFLNSGWSGDKVTGGSGGNIELRLKRDVINYKPTVVTIFLGMNDGLYRPYDEATFQRYATGLTHIVDELSQALPGVRFTLLTPSMFDYNARPRPAPPADLTGYSARLPAADYNDTLIKYGDFVKSLGKQHNIPVADLNAPMVAATAVGRKTDPNFALYAGARDGIHPDAVGHLIMAAAVLKAWNAPSTVADIEIGLDKPTKATTLLPWPIPNDAIDALRVSPLPGALNVFSLHTSITPKNKAKNLVLTRHLEEDGIPTTTTMLEDADHIRIFVSETPNLPQNVQAQKVLALINQRTDTWFAFWKGKGTGIVSRTDEPTDDELTKLRTENTVLDDLRAQAYAAAQPAVHTWLIAHDSH